MKICINLLTYVLARVTIKSVSKEMIKITGSELEKLLKDGGCQIKREGANHCLWQNPKTGKTFAVPRHKAKEIPTGTANRILKDAGLKLSSSLQDII